MFGGSGGGLFGSTQPAQQSTGLFGAAAPSTGLFGSSTGGSNLFGSSTAGGGGLFGSTTQNRPTGGGLFGTTQPAQQQQQQAGGLFGSSQPSTGLFGSSTMSTGGGGGLFGATTAQQPQQQTGGLFGSTTQPSTGLFGSPQPAGGLFGSSTTPTTFGTTAVSQGTGTRDLKYRDDLNRDSSGGKVQAICNLPEVNQQKSLEELRWEDYQLGLTSGKTPTSLGSSAGLFGSGTTGGGIFGGAAPQPQQQAGGLFGGTTTGGLFSSTPSTGGGLFGQKPATPSTGGLFGSTAAPTTGGLFGSAPQSTGLFGSTATQPAAAGGGLFGSSAPSGGLFGSVATTQPTSGGLFGSTQTTAPTTGLFGQTTGTSSWPLSDQRSLSGGGLFGSTAPTTGGGLFGSTQQQPQQGGGLFGTTTSPSTGGGLFGTTPQQATTGGLFGTTPSTTTGTTGGLFGSTTGGGLFGQKTETTPGLFGQTGGGLFGGATSTPAAAQSTGGLFGQKPATTGLFGTTTGTTGTTSAGTGLFGQQPSTSTTGTGLFGNLGQSSTGGGLFGSLGQTSTGGGLFGNLGQPSTGGGLFGSSMGQSLGGIGTQQPLSAQTGLSQQQLVPCVPDPYGIQRLGLMSGMYGAPAMSALMGGWPGGIPNPFAFPTPGVILPTQFRRFKSATLSQIWRPLPEYTAEHRRLQLPSATPRRQRTLPPPRNSTTSSLKLDYGWNDRDLSNMLYPPRTTMGTPHRRSPSVGRLSTARGQWTPFTQVASSESDEEADSRYGAPANRNLRVAERTQQARRLRQKWREGQDTTDKPLGHLQESDSRTPLKHRRAFDTDTGEDVRGGRSMSRGFTPREVPYTQRQQTSRSGPLKDDWTLSLRQTGKLKLGFTKDARDESLVPKCTLEGYSTKPSIETLQSYNGSRLSTVEDFTVIRDGYGEVTWPGLTDVRGLNVDLVVKIEDKAIEVYPSNYTEITGNSVPEIGVGLNRTALVTLLNCRPKNLTSTDENSEEFRQAYEDHVRKLRKYTEKMNAHFVSLSTNWAWKFRVDHFSRYGYQEEEEDSRRPMTEQPAVQASSGSRIHFMNATTKLEPGRAMIHATTKPVSSVLSGSKNLLTSRDLFHQKKRVFLDRTGIHQSRNAVPQRQTTTVQPQQPESFKEQLELLCQRLGVSKSSDGPKTEPELLELLLGRSDDRSSFKRRPLRSFSAEYAHMFPSRNGSEEFGRRIKSRKTGILENPSSQPDDADVLLKDLRERKEEERHFLNEVVTSTFQCLGFRLNAATLQPDEIDQ
ncbi:uncharacterized protein LOC129617695 [Condylostylus longicornis]|uniref:uncharacterized protein LOC129617695 n=1 Tax=Condylostylus longicornis TaxID=2530218 RepID=UPI00244E0D0F|nr:uncharacterized protein LOC129617695 [Condylostylus longicornis]